MPSQDLIQILHENKTQHLKLLKNASGIGFQEMSGNDLF
jgi:hypothetical protein